MVCLIELLAVFVTSGKFYIKQPWVFLLIQLFFVGILFCIPKNKVRHIVASAFLALFMIVNLVFIVIFEMTETIFDYGMLSLRNDAMSILESVPINFLYFSISALLVAGFIIFGGRYAKHNNGKLGFKYIKVISAISMVAVLVSNIFVLYFGNKNLSNNIYEKLYKSNDSSYAQMGITANFVNEMFKGTFLNNVELGDESELEEYLYKDVYNSMFDDLSENYNLVTILVESFEWTSFVEDFELFVNGYHLVNPETGTLFSETEANNLLSNLFPNIYDYYKSSIALTNFYSREKTDIAENLCLLGAYPTNAYINYDFPDNKYVSSIPSVLKTLTNGEIACNAFHNGSYTYYNRNEELISVGFDNYYASDQMIEMGMTDYQSNGERNLDSEMIEVCADKMFPSDEKFYTHITTITMHGQYTFRQNLADAGYYDELAEYGITAKTENLINSDVSNYNNFYYYIACVKEFDKALGKIMSELAERNLASNTIIMLYGDHNTYYSSLSNYVKNIDSTDDDNYTSLWRVPCMIYHPNIDEIIDIVIDNLTSKLDSTYVITTSTNSKGETVRGLQVKKFACTADILPTLFDLMGINFYENFYFGHSIFSEKSSVLYSRAYNIFATDCIYFSSLNNIKWIRKTSNELDENIVAMKYADIFNYNQQQYLESVEAEARNLLKKLDACNRIFYNDFFAKNNIHDSSKTNAEIFAENMKTINA